MVKRFRIGSSIQLRDERTNEQVLVVATLYARGMLCYASALRFG